MRKLILLLAIIASSVNFACLSTQSETTELVLVIDNTDPLTSLPTNEIYNQLGLEQDIWQGVKLTVTFLSDRDINSRTVLNLSPGNRYQSNNQLRKAEVARFKTDFSKAVMVPKDTATKAHSILYRSIAKEINLLSTSTTRSRFFLIYSNLMENAELVFFDPETLALINSKPQTIIKQLESQIRLKNLQGIKVSLIYEPASFQDNNRYMAVATLYKRMFDAKGASTQIVQSFALQP